MIDGLISGKLFGKAAHRVGQSGKPFVTAKVRTPLANGDAMFVAVITFSESVGATLLALDDGESVSLAGVLQPKVWTDKTGEVRPALDMVAHGALTAYHVTRKRQAVTPQPVAKATPRPTSPHGSGPNDMADDLPWECDDAA